MPYNGKTLTPVAPTAIAAGDRLYVGDVDADAVVVIEAEDLLDALLRVSATGGVVMFDGTAGKLVVRQRGGVAGTDQVEIYHTGSVVRIDNAESTTGIMIDSSGNVYAAGSIVAQVGPVWLSNDIDTAVSRVTAGVVGPNGGWFQNTSGRAVLGSAHTNDTVTPSNVTGLGMTLKAGRKYTGRMVCFFSNTIAVDGVRVDFNGGTATMTAFAAAITSNVQGATLSVTTSVALDTDMIATTMGVTTTVVIAFDISLTVNAAGTFIPRVGLEADSGGVITTGIGSYLWLEDTP